MGDRLIVHFTNNLPRPSTIHWHGLRIPIDMDGVPGYSQEPVQPGETFTYRFVVPDADIGARVRPLEWKDTVDIPHDRTVRLAVRFDDRPGTWIFHCHILDHADGGLLGAVHLDLPAETFRNLTEH